MQGFCEIWREIYPKAKMGGIDKLKFIDRCYILKNLFSLDPNTTYSVSIMAINKYGKGERTSAISASIGK